MFKRSNLVPLVLLFTAMLCLFAIVGPVASEAINALHGGAGLA